MSGHLLRINGAMHRKRHPIHGQNIKLRSLKFQIQIAVGRRVYDSPELPLTGSHFDLRPQRAIHGKYFARLLRFSAANVGTKFHTAFRIPGGRVTPIARPRTIITRSGSPTACGV